MTFGLQGAASDHVAPVRIAVLLPCYNEGGAIARTVEGFAQSLPDATIYVYDNNSKDDTREVAARAGAVVREEPIQGKGQVVRRMFADIEADIYVLADGDATYDATDAPKMIDLLRSRTLDMVVAVRRTEQTAAYRPGHRFGNRMLTGLLSSIFGRTFTDVLSGYRVFSRRFVKSFPILSLGFEIETEISVHALQLRMPAAEVTSRYFSRPHGSESKLATYRDGTRILTEILNLFRMERPLPFFGGISVGLVVLALILAAPLVVTYVETGLVPRLPTAVLAMGLVILGSLSLCCGLILDTVVRGRLEVRRLAYLSFAAPAALKPATLTTGMRAPEPDDAKDFETSLERLPG